MAKYQITAPDGSSYEVTAPDNATPDQVMSYAKSNFNQDGGFVDTLKQGARQVGLTARYGIEGAGDALDTLASPFRYAINTAINPPSNAQEALSGSANDPIRGRTGKSIADLIGLPEPKTPYEKIVGSGARTMTGVAAFGGGSSGLVDKVSSPIVKNLVQQMSAQPLQQAGGAIGGGMMGEAAKESGMGWGGQFLASLAGGVGGAATAGGIERAVNSAANTIKNLRAPQITDADVRLRLNNVLQESGFDLTSIPADIRASLIQEARKSFEAGKELNPDVVSRLADYAAVGATPLRGNVTMNPVLITQEKNLAKYGANSTSPELQALAERQNANNAKLIEALDNLGANGQYAGDTYAAGKQAIGAVQSRDANAKAVENFLYSKARDSSGRAIDLDREGFIMSAYQNLAQENKGAWLPPEIAGLLSQIRKGVTTIDGQEYPIPFNVDVIDNLKTSLAAASRGASDGNARRAIGIVRDALENTPLRAVGRPVGGNQAVDPAAMNSAQNLADNISQGAMDAFDRARSFARSRRNWQESAPGIEAALDGATPEQFIKNFIISNSGKSGAENVSILLKTINKSPEARQAVREAVLGHLKYKATRFTPTKETDNALAHFKNAFNEELRNIGDHKLRVIFTKEELAQLKAIGRVSRYETYDPKGSAVNYSGTAATAAGMIDRAINAVVKSKIPVLSPATGWVDAQIKLRQSNPLPAAVTSVQNEREKLPLSALLLPAVLNR